jgi:glutamyl-tRNA synthetase
MADGRFAPSPTGALHLGNLRTAMVAWLFARGSRSRFVVRMEDLDRATSSAANEQLQLDDLAALGIDWDGEVERQSEHFDRHRAAVDALTEAGLTYPCYCSRREIREAAAAPHDDRARGASSGASDAAALLPDGAYPGTCRDLDDKERRAREAAGRRPAIRLRVPPGTEVAFDDRVHGTQRGCVDDFVLARNDGVPAYNLAVVVDDAAQGVGEVVRGDDLLSSTPRQIHLARVLGLPVPEYAHVPLVLGPDRSRLAKRHGAVTLDDLARAGMDAAAVRSLLAHSLNLCARGEPVTMGDLLERFDPARLPRAPWVVDLPR